MTARWWIVSLACVLGGSSVARAEASSAEAYLEVVPQAGTRAPLIRATLIDAPTASREAITLRDARGQVVPAAAVIPFAGGTERVAIAFVVQGEEVWIGNDTIEPEDSPARFVGALEGVRSAIDGLHLAERMPAGSEAALITYDDRVRVAIPMGPIARLSGAALGTQHDYYGRLGHELVSGIDVGMAELRRSTADIKILVVIGDGTDTNNEAAIEAMPALQKHAATEGIRAGVVIYKGQLSEPVNIIQRFAPRASTASSFHGIAAGVAELVDAQTTRYTVLFPGEQLAWDGDAHELSVAIRGSELEPLTLVLGQRATEQAWWPLAWWMQLAIGMGAVGGIALVMRLRARATMQA